MSEPAIDRRRVFWRVHLRASPPRVYEAIATSAGRRRFWAESADERESVIEFSFPNGAVLRSRVLERDPPRRFVLEYFGGSRVELTLTDDGGGGTDLVVEELGIDPAEWAENHAGWVSVLLALKAAVDFGVDLRNHDSRRTWERGFVDN